LSSKEIYCDASRLKSKTTKIGDTYWTDPSRGDYRIRGPTTAHPDRKDDAKDYEDCDDPKAVPAGRAFTVSSNIQDRKKRKEALKRGEKLDANSYSVEHPFAAHTQMCRAFMQRMGDAGWPKVERNRVEGAMTSEFVASCKRQKIKPIDALTNLGTLLLHEVGAYDTELRLLLS
jgi:hypothetical protein